MKIFEEIQIFLREKNQKPETAANFRLKKF